LHWRSIGAGWPRKAPAEPRASPVRKPGYSLTETGVEALKSDAEQRMEMRAANRPRRR
jgi:hypothetical protein